MVKKKKKRKKKGCADQKQLRGHRRRPYLEEKKSFLTGRENSG